MRTLNNERMRDACKRAARKIRRAKIKVPPDGAMFSLLYGDINKDGDHWQVELIHDERFQKEPWIAAYRWTRPAPMCAKSANYVLTADVKGNPIKGRK